MAPETSPGCEAEFTPSPRSRRKGLATPMLAGLEGEHTRSVAITLLMLTLAQSTGEVNATGQKDWRGSAPVQFSSSRTCKGMETERQLCPEQPPCEVCKPVDCYFTSWGEWFDAGGCTGLCFRHRGIMRSSNECGKPCDGVKEEAKPCIRSECRSQPNQDCAYSDWSAWSLCSSESGQKSRGRHLVKNVTGNGKPCTGSLNQTVSCGAFSGVDCQLSSWGAWTPCSATCGGGFRAAMRRVVVRARLGGKPCQGALRRTVHCNVNPCEEPRDCELSDWTNWTGCDTEAPTQKYRTRAVITPTAGSGRPCHDAVRETVGCADRNLVIPVPCKVTEWSRWAPCDKTCDGGQTYRRRSMISPPERGGKCAPRKMFETEACNTHMCRDESGNDCSMSAWSQWGTCSGGCGTGTSTRSRNVSRYAVIDGVGCQGRMSEARGCKLKECAKQDCVWNDWEDWSICPVSCGGGTKYRQRKIRLYPYLGGKFCDPKETSEMKSCGTQSCTVCVDGMWGAWSSWSKCSATCDTGYRTRHRDVARAPNACGRPAVGLEDMYEPCANEWRCQEDHDCKLSAWSSWTACSCACFGIKERRRNVVAFAQGLGKSCVSTALTMSAPCNPSLGGVVPPDCMHDARQDCEFTQWSDWDSCSASCNGGQQKRTRSFTPNILDGEPCRGATHETKACGTEECAFCVDCEWSDWSDWSGCGRQCNDQKYRRRSVKQLPNYCGEQCKLADSKQVTACKGVCPQQRFCAWSDWANMGRCDVHHCGYRLTRLRHRTLEEFRGAPPAMPVFFSANSSITCVGAQVSAVACPYVPCEEAPPTDCQFSAWSQWSAPFGTGLCERSRTIQVMNANGGKPCSGSVQQTAHCPVPKVVPQDCKISAWSHWSACTGPTSQRTRTRAVQQVGADGGEMCHGILRETMGCNYVRQPKVDCMMQPWQGWSKCSQSCGGGLRERARRIQFRSANGGEGCWGDPLREVDKCNVAACGGNAVDCELSAWSSWMSVSVHQRMRGRRVLRMSTNGGTPCGGALTEFAPALAAVDCRVSEWTAWDDCDRPCGVGQHVRHRIVVQNPQHGGLPCPYELVQTEGCNAFPCSMDDCRPSAWSPWMSCSATCGPGQQTRARTIAHPAAPDGHGCTTDLVETRHCDAGSCPQTDCLWNDWTDWSGCSCDCDGGTQSRQRTIKREPRKGGQPCPAFVTDEVQPCNTHPCRNDDCIDGVWDDWGDWEDCSLTCRGGVTWRARKVLVEASACGAELEGDSHETASCNLDVPCQADIDCQFGPWQSYSACTEACNGVKARVRLIQSFGTGQGLPCYGRLREVAPCNPSIGEPTPPQCATGLPLDCVLSDWTAWGACSRTCGVGQRPRQREVLRNPQHGGKSCDPILEETCDCGNDPCIGDCIPQGCRWGDWGFWSACDKCGGEKRRSRHIMQLAECGGAQCHPKDAEEMTKCDRSCEDKSYCSWSDWQAWGRCATTCGHGVRERHRSLEVRRVPHNLEFLQEDAVDFDDTTIQTLHATLLDRAKTLEARRTQELTMAFVSGLVGIFALVMLAKARGTRGQVANYLPAGNEDNLPRRGLGSHLVRIE